jgi:hypothetical protein
MSSFQQDMILSPITVRPTAFIGDWELIVLPPDRTAERMHDFHSDQSAPDTYFFHIILNGSPSGQSDGLLFPDKAAAWREASMSCGEIIREMDGKIKPGCNWQMEVSDHAGHAIYRFTFKAEEL